MDARRARLGLLFSGNDSQLLDVNAKRYFELPPEPKLETPAPQQSARPQEPTSTTHGSNSNNINNNNIDIDNSKNHALPSDTMTRGQADQDSDEEGFDEYLSAFSKPSVRQGFPTTAPADSNGTSASTNNKPTAATSDDLGVKHDAYVPVVALSRFPYRYIHGPERDVVAKQFFDAGKFWARSWVL